MFTRRFLTQTVPAVIIAAGLSACQPPPSVQAVIDKKEAIEEANTAIILDDPVLDVAQDQGRAIYTRYLIGRWAPEGLCGTPTLEWSFTEEDYAKPEEKPCAIAVIEALADGSYAIAGYCPRVEVPDEADVVIITRTGADSIIIPGTKGGPLVRC